MRHSLRAVCTMVVVLLVVCLGVSSASATSPQQSAADLFQQALMKERAEGKLEEAIEIYRAVVGTAGSDRNLAAQALVRIGSCYEKRGMREARQAYEQVLSEYADQTRPAAEARARLEAFAAIDTSEPRSAETGGGPVARKLVSSNDPGMWEDKFLGVELSPDGRRVAYAVLQDLEQGVPALVVRDIGSDEEVRLTNHGARWIPGATRNWDLASAQHENISGMEWSPDGTRIAFTARRPIPDSPSTLMVVDVETAELSIPPATAAFDLRLLDWSRDGEHLLCNMFRPDRTASLVMIDMASGDVVPLISQGWEGSDARLSPDGNFVAFSRREDGVHHIYVLATDGSSENLIATGDRSRRAPRPIWSPDGQAIAYRNASAVWVIAVTDGAPQSAPRILRSGPSGKMLGAPYGGFLDWTELGGFTYIDNNAALAAYQVGVDPASGAGTGDIRPLEGVAETAQWFEWSPDMSRIAFTEWIEPQLMNVYSTSEHSLRAIDLGAVESTNRIWWSNDGEQILVEPWADTNKTVVAIDAVESTVEPLFSPLDGASRLHLSPDQSKMIYQTERDGVSSLVIRDLAYGSENVLAVAPERGMFAGYLRPAFSPDGTQVLFGTQEYDQGWKSSVWIVPAAAGSPRKLAEVTNPPDGLQKVLRYAVWDPSGRYVAYSEGENLFVVDIDGGDPRLVETPAEWTQIDVHDWSPDGSWIGVVGGSGAQPELWTIYDILGAVESDRRR